MTPQHIIEAALLSSRRPMPVREIRRLFDDRLSAKSVKEHLAELQAFWEDRGMRLVELSDGWRFQTASELGPRFLRLDEEKPPVRQVPPVPRGHDPYARHPHPDHQGQRQARRH